MAQSSTELVFGLVYSVGTDYSPILQTLQDHLKTFQYEPIIIRVSDCLLQLKSFGLSRKTQNEDERINKFMTAGNEVRKKSKHNDEVIRLATAMAIYNSRLSQQKPEIKRRAYILYSLKHPDEVLTLRRIYGPGFFLIGIYSSEHDRLEFLKQTKGIDKEKGQKLIERDRDEGLSYGQQTRKTFAMADFFVRKDSTAAIERLLDLVFGDPFCTPTRQEQGMFFAYSASARSGDLSRQVGAAIVSSRNDLLAVGTNDVPRAGGGLYWEGDNPDGRDMRKRFDSNHIERTRIGDKIFKQLSLKIPKKHHNLIRLTLEQSGLPDLIEFGRAVHAEMEALLSCARNGVSTRGATLFSTTFPCHLCAKHIVGAGISKIVYIEPYAKSREPELHDDSVRFTEDSVGHDTTKVDLVPFIGVGPRRYFDLFSINLSTGYSKKREENGKIRQWERAQAVPRVPMLSVTYLEVESLLSLKTIETLKEHGLISKAHSPKSSGRGTKPRKLKGG